MKKLLYGTTALAAAGLLAGTANAADPIKMGVGGYMQMFAVYMSQNDGAGETAAGAANNAIKREGEIIFNGKTTLDNGLEFGVQVQLEAESSTDQIDESYIWVEGGFGRINMGSENSAPTLMHYAPSAPGGVGFEYVNFQFTNGHSVGGLRSVNTYQTMTEDSEKLTYFTPRMAGFQLGVSYTPDGGTSGGAAGGEAGSVTGQLASYSGMPLDYAATKSYNQIVELGANYVNKLGGADVALSGGYGKAQVKDATVGGNPPTNGKDRVQWSLGGRVGMMGFTVAAAYAKDNNGDTRADRDTTDWDAGVNYATGPWSVGVAYYERTAQQGTGVQDDTFKAWEVGGKYTLGPGVTLGAGVQGSKVDSAGTVNDNDATAVYVGTMLSF